MYLCVINPVTSHRDSSYNICTNFYHIVNPEATKPFRHTWKSLPDTCANFRCVTENCHDWSKRKTYLECDALDLNCHWKKSRFYLDGNLKFGRGEHPLSFLKNSTLSLNRWHGLLYYS
jgi:hypothetical protein